MHRACCRATAPSGSGGRAMRYESNVFWYVQWCPVLCASCNRACNPSSRRAKLCSGCTAAGHMSLWATASPFLVPPILTGL